MAAPTLSRASAIVDSAETSTIKQRKVVQAKSTIHTASSSSDSSSSSDNESDSDYTQTFTPPTFTVKDLLGELTVSLAPRPPHRQFSQNFEIGTTRSERAASPKQILSIITVIQCTDTS